MTRTIIALLTALRVADGYTLHIPSISAPVVDAATNTPTATNTATAIPAPGEGAPTSTSTNTPTATTEPSATPTDTPTPTETTETEDTATPTATDTPTLTPTPTETTPASGPCPCDANTLNCTDFATQPQAQACFNWCVSQGAGDIHKLDQDNDGVACESLPPNFKVLEVAR